MTAPNPFINAGDLVHRVTFESRSQTTDASGGPSTVWTAVLSAYASIEALAGRELLAAQAINVEATHQIIVRYRSALADPLAVAAMRLRFLGRIFDIKSASNTSERNFEIVILAGEGVNLG